MKKFFVAILIAVGIVGSVLLTHLQHGNPSNASTPLSDNTTGANSASTSTSASSTPAPSTSSSTSSYKDGSYSGQAVDVGYGVVQVRAVVSGGKLTEVKFLSLPSGGHSSEVSNFAGPQLRSEALQAQSSNVDIVSGATSTSQGFMQSLQAALSQAS